MQRPPGALLKARTPGFAHHNIAFSPFVETRFAVASGANFGLVGNGRVHIMEIGNGGPGVQVTKFFETQDSVYDVAWNESHENQVIAACGDGGLRLFDITLQGPPIKKWHEHAAEVVSVDWNNLQKDAFVSASWDSTVKVWSIHRQTAIVTIQVHHPDIRVDSWTALSNLHHKVGQQVYNVQYSPHHPSLIAVSAPLGLLKIYDSRSSTAASGTGFAQAQIRVTESELLHCDWNKYDPNLIATGSKDGGVRVIDLRKGAEDGPRRMHPMAVRKVAWSPHRKEVLASSGYDMSCHVWNLNSPNPILVHSNHTEFVMGLAWALFDPGLLATAAWDEEVHLFRT